MKNPDYRLEQNQRIMRTSSGIVLSVYNLIVRLHAGYAGNFNLGKSGKPTQGHSCRDDQC